MLTREKLATILVLLFSASLQGCCKKYEHLNIKKKQFSTFMDHSEGYPPGNQTWFAGPAMFVQ
jgi:hypothetical protein